MKSKMLRDWQAGDVNVGPGPTRSTAAVWPASVWDPIVAARGLDAGKTAGALERGSHLGGTSPAAERRTNPGEKMLGRTKRESRVGRGDAAARTQWLRAVRDLPQDDGETLDRPCCEHV